MLSRLLGKVCRHCEEAKPRNRETAKPRNSETDDNTFGVCHHKNLAGGRWLRSGTSLKRQFHESCDFSRSGFGALALVCLCRLVRAAFACVGTKHPCGNTPVGGTGAKLETEGWKDTKPPRRDGTAQAAQAARQQQTTIPAVAIGGATGQKLSEGGHGHSRASQSGGW